MPPDYQTTHDPMFLIMPPLIVLGFIIQFLGHELIIVLVWRAADAFVNWSDPMLRLIFLGRSPFPLSWFKEWYQANVHATRQRRHRRACRVFQRVSGWVLGADQAEAPWKPARTDQTPITTDGEIIDESIKALVSEVERAETRVKYYESCYQVAAKQTESFAAEAAELRVRLRDLEQVRVTAQELPAGRLVLRGRLVRREGGLVVLPGGKRYVRLATPDLDLPGENGDQALVEAVWNDEAGWCAWRLRVEQVAAGLAPLDVGLVERLMAVRKKGEATAPDFDELDRQAIENAVFKANHSVSAISLHLVCPFKYRQSITPEQASTLKRVVTEVIREKGIGTVQAIEVGHDEKGGQLTHLHVLMSAVDHTTPNSLGKTVGIIKALSSKRTRVAHPDLPNPLYSASYWLGSAGGGSLDRVREYVNGNADKHAETEEEANEIFD